MQDSGVCGPVFGTSDLQYCTRLVVLCLCCPLQANKSDLTRKEREMWNISLQGLIYLGVIIVVDVLFHFMYILTIPTDIKLLKHLSDWALGMCHSICVIVKVLSTIMGGKTFFCTPKNAT